jgi:hypothetical protein
METLFATPPPDLVGAPREDLLALVRIAERLAGETLPSDIAKACPPLPWRGRSGETNARACGSPVASNPILTSRKRSQTGPRTRAEDAEALRSEQTSGLQAQMQAQGLLDVEHDRVRDDAQPIAHPLHGDRSDLLGLRLGVAIEARRRGWK